MTRALLTASIALLCAGATRADTIQATSLASEDWGTCQANFSQVSATSAYVSLGASCGSPDISGYSSATVSQTPILATFSLTGAVATDTYRPGTIAADPQGSVTANATDTATLLATGSTGPGILLLQFLLTGHSANDAAFGGGGGVDYAFTVNGGNDGFCPTAGIGEFNCGNGYSLFAGIPIVFGMPFSVSEALNVIAGSLGNGMASFSIASTLDGYSLETPGGAPIAGATLSDFFTGDISGDPTGSDPPVLPEPSTLGLSFLGLTLIGLSAIPRLRKQRIGRVAWQPENLPPNTN